MSLRDLNRLPRLRRLPRPLAATFALALWGGVLAQPAHAADVARGRQLYEFSAATLGVSGLASCSSCHHNAASNAALDPVVDLRRTIGGSEFAALTAALVRPRLDVGLANSAMAAYRGVLTPADLDDLAAYIADTPSTDPTDLSLWAEAVGVGTNGVFTLTHSTATTAPLQVVKVTVSGVGSGSYVASGCEGQTLNPGNQCSVQVQFKPADSERKNAQVLISLKQQDVNFSRLLDVTGGVKGLTAEAGSGASLSPTGVGGGSLSLGWLLALLAAAWAARQLRSRLHEVERTRTVRQAIKPKPRRQPQARPAPLALESDEPAPAGAVVTLPGRRAAAVSELPLGHELVEPARGLRAHLGTQHRAPAEQPARQTERLA